MKSTKSTKHCVGCRDDYYNHNRDEGCWSLRSARVVTRYKLGWWTRPTEPGAFTKVKTYHCHHAPGLYALFEALPTNHSPPVHEERE